MSNIDKAGAFKLGHRVVKRLGYGAMQLAGPGVFGPPKDRDAAVAVLREAVASGVNHIDTSDFYGPHVTNQIIREALHPYPDDLVIVTKISARRGPDGSWLPAFSREELIQAVHDNLRNLGLDVLEVVNLRSMFNVHGPAEGSIEAPIYGQVTFGEQEYSPQNQDYFSYPTLNKGYLSDKTNLNYETEPEFVRNQQLIACEQEDDVEFCRQKYGTVSPGYSANIGTVDKSPVTM